jgi:hypothetical protein
MLQPTACLTPIRRWCPDDGHIFTIVNQADAIVAALMTP